MNERVRTIAGNFGQSIVRVWCVCAQLLLLGMLLFFAESPAHAQSPELVGWYCPYCKRYYDMNASCPHTSGGTGSGGKSKKKSSYSHDMNMMIIETVGEAFQNAIIAQQKAKQKAQQQAEAAALAAQKKEAALAAQQKAQTDKDAMQSWFMEQSAAQREKAGKQVAGQRVLSSLMGVSSENAGHLAPLGAFRWDKPRTDLQLMPSGSVSAPDTAFGQLQAAAGFSKAATSAGDMDEAHMLASQAGLVMPGGTGALQAPVHQLPEVPPASPPMRVDEKEQIEITIKNNNQKLQGLETKQKEIEARKKAINDMEEDAKNMAAQATQLRDSTQPQDKQNAVYLARAAEELRKHVDQQRTEADQVAKALDDQIGQTKNALEQDNAALKRLTTADREDQSDTENLNAR